MDYKTTLQKVCRATFFLSLVFALPFFLEKYVFGDEGNTQTVKNISPDGTTSPANSADDLEKTISQIVKHLGYSDQVALQFAAMVRPWKCQEMRQQLLQAAESFKQKKMTRDQYAHVEYAIANRLAQTIIREIADADLSREENRKYYDLAAVVRDKKAQCLGYSQVFFILGNSLGLTVQGIFVFDNAEGATAGGMEYVACVVGLNNGKALQVDLKLLNCISNEYSFAETYEKAGDSWKLKKSENSNNLYSKISLLSKSGLAAAVGSNRGFMQYRDKKFTEAIEEYNRAIIINPRYVEAYLNRGRALLELDKSAEAFADFNKAIELNPQYPDIFNSRGGAYSKAGKYNEAITDFEKAIALNPKYSEAFANRANVYFLMGKLSEAMEDCNKAIRLNANNATAYVTRGCIYSQTGKLMEAITDFSKAIKLNPQSVEAYANRGGTYSQLNEGVREFIGYPKSI